MKKTIKIDLTDEENELIEILVQKSNVRESSIVRRAFDKFVNQNLDLLSKEEKLKFKKILIQK